MISADPDSAASAPSALKKEEPATADLLRGYDRRKVIDQLIPLRAQGKSIADCAALIGIPAPTLWRIERDYKLAGTDGLTTKHANAGRKKLARHATENDILGLQRLKLVTGSDATALSMWADSPACTPELRSAILRRRKSRHNFPASLRQLCHVTPEVEAKFRGDRTYQLESFVQARDCTQIEAGPDGELRRVPVEPGDWFECDDQSVNQPFWWEDPDGDSPLARRQGAAVGRQSLMCQDVRGKWLGAELVGRPRDAYRASDILRFLRRVFEVHGLPRKGIRLERGIWKSRVIAGIQVPGMGDDEREKLFGGLTALGLRVEWCYSPHHKGGIESGFNYLQTVESVLALGDGYTVDLGRVRGEFERGAKALIAAHAGRKHPRDLGFLHISERAERLWAACTRCNSVEPKEGRIQHGVPDEGWAKSIAQNPLRPLAKEKLWIFLPNEACVQLRGGHVSPKVEGEFVRFCAPELFAELGSGYPVRVRFDRTEPSLGAWIFNDAAADDPRNRTGAKRGAYLGWAEYSPDAPQFDAVHGFDGRLRKRFDARVRSEFRALGLFGRKVAAAAENRDGAGEVNRVERGARTGLAPAVRRARTAPAEPAPAVVEDFTAPHRRATADVPAADSPPLLEEW